MNRGHKLLLPLMLAIVLAGASMAFAAGSGSPSLAGGGSEWHRICISHPEGWYYEFEFKVFPNGTAVGREPFSADGAAGFDEYVYGTTTRTGFAFAWSYYDFGGTEGNVLHINRNRTWCEYEFEEDELYGELCGDWKFGDCDPKGTKRAVPWSKE